jgi:Family of unknown function (DUF6627)
MQRRLSRTAASVLVVCLCALGLPVPAAHAELVATDRIASPGLAQPSARARLDAILDRADVRAELERHGVTADQAKARVDALSDDEVERLAARFDALPAGGDVLGTALVLGFITFIVLLITDILGFTRVFSFTRPAK